MSTVPTPLEIAQLGADHAQKMFGALNAAAIAVYNKAVASYYAVYGTHPGPGAPPLPAPPMLSTVDASMYIQLSGEINVLDSEWAKVVISFPYIPVNPPPPTPATPLYTIGAPNPYMQGFFAVSVSTNAHDDLRDGTKIVAENMATPDGHSYMIHVYGFGNVLAQMTS